MGDFNINYLKRSDNQTKKAIEFAHIYGLRQLILSATNLRGFSSSCIDLMFTNANFVCVTGVLNDVVSDHFPIFACIKKSREKMTYSTNLGRTYTSYNKELFTNYSVTNHGMICKLLLIQTISGILSLIR